MLDEGRAEAISDSDISKLANELACHPADHAFAGGVLRALSRKRFKIRELIASPICGALASAYLTVPFMHYMRSTGWPLPAEEQPVMLASAFLTGTCAMWISDLQFEMIVRRFVPKEPDGAA